MSDTNLKISPQTQSSPEPRTVVPEFAHGLSATRRTWIVVVLLFTMGGFFLLDDAPQHQPVVAVPTADAARMQQFVSDLNFVPMEPGEHSPSSRSHQLPFPNADRRAAGRTVQDIPSSALTADTRIDPTLEFEPVEREQSFSDAQLKLPSSPAAPMPIVRFTGRIEPVQ